MFRKKKEMSSSSIEKKKEVKAASKAPVTEFHLTIVSLKQLDKLPEGICSTTFSPSGSFAMKAKQINKKDALKIYNSEGKEIRSINDQIDNISEFCWLDDQHLLMVRDKDYFLYQWDIGSKTKIKPIIDFKPQMEVKGDFPHANFLNVFPGKKVVCGFFGGEILLMDINSKKKRLLTKLPTKLNAASKMNDDQIVCVSLNVKNPEHTDVTLYNINTEKVVWSLIVENANPLRNELIVLGPHHIALTGTHDIIDLKNNTITQAGRGVGFNYICALPDNMYATIERNFDKDSVNNEENCKFVLYVYDLFSHDEIVRIPIPNVSTYTQFLLNPYNLHFLINNNGTLYDLDIGLKSYLDYRKEMIEKIENQLTQSLNRPLTNLTLQYVGRLGEDKTKNTQSDNAQAGKNDEAASLSRQKGKSF